MATRWKTRPSNAPIASAVEDLGLEWNILVNLFTGSSLRLTRINTQCVMKPEMYQWGAHLYQFTRHWRYNTVAWLAGDFTKDPVYHNPGWLPFSPHAYLAFSRTSWCRFFTVCRIPTLAPYDKQTAMKRNSMIYTAWACCVCMFECSCHYSRLPRTESVGYYRSVPS